MLIDGKSCSIPIWSYSNVKYEYRDILITFTGEGKPEMARLEKNETGDKSFDTSSSTSTCIRA